MDVRNTIFRACHSAQGISVDPSKVEVVLQWERPKTVTEIRSFVGLAGYYKRFIEGFSKIVAPLTQLTRKDHPFAWTEQCERSFEELKRRLINALVLTIPDTNKSFEVFCDASYQGLGYVLMQNNFIGNMNDYFTNSCNNLIKVKNKSNNYNKK